MSDFREFVGKTTEEALQKASAHYDLPLNRLEVEVVSAGSSGLFGILMAKKAKVRVRPLAGSGLEAEMAELAAVVKDSHHPRPPRPTPPAAPAPPVPDLAQALQPAPAPEAAAPAAGDQWSEVTEIRRVHPSPAPPAQPQAAPAPAEPAQVQARAEAPALPNAPGPRPPADRPPLDLSPQEEDDEEAGPEAEDEIEAPADQRLEQDPQVVAQARDVLARLVAPLDATAQVSAQSGPQGIELAVQGQDVGVLIGRRGQNLEALQYLVTRIVSHGCGRPVRVVVDAGEYRRRRSESLEDLARRMAHKARQSGKPVAVGPLSAQERRVVHLALKGEAGLTTSSRGRGELKKVIIAPSRPGIVPGVGQ